jgi:hypothetical protein
MDLARLSMIQVPTIHELYRPTQYALDRLLKNILSSGIEWAELPGHV